MQPNEKIYMCVATSLPPFVWLISMCSWFLNFVIFIWGLFEPTMRHKHENQPLSKVDGPEEEEEEREENRFIETQICNVHLGYVTRKRWQYQNS